MIGLRNLLVHDYASINLNLVYEFLQTRLPDFGALTKYIAEWLEKEDPSPEEIGFFNFGKVPFYPVELSRYGIWLAHMRQESMTMTLKEFHPQPQKSI